MYLIGSGFFFKANGEKEKRVEWPISAKYGRLVAGFGCRKKNNAIVTRKQITSLPERTLAKC